MSKKVILYILLCCAAPSFAQTDIRIQEGLSMKSKILGQDIKYSIILPKDYYSTQKAYPVVYLLHGLGDDESSWLEYGRVTQYTDGAVKRGEIQPMIYIMPQGFRTYYVNDFAGKFMYQDMFVKELVPFIDKKYRTIPNTEHRATMGYSMGGYGALILPLKHPEVFTVSVPLSISVRTDEQYKTEDGSEWDEQWGRLFGGVGLTGEPRLTDYYKQHSPFHIFKEQDLSKLKGLKLYIDNGDDEYTLARSNEELHMLLRDRNFPHEFRVRNGGHQFSYWREALPNGLRFISDAFEGKPYRGDIKDLSNDSEAAVVVKNEIVEREQYDVLLPVEYESTLRLYPVVYFLGDFDQQTKNRIASNVNLGIQTDALPPLITIFLKEDQKDLITSIIPSVEKEYRARSGYRFRALIGFEKGGVAALKYALTPLTFTSCALFDSPIDNEGLKQAISQGKKELGRTWLYIATVDKSKNYQTNGNAHLLLRDEDIYHEYRVQEGLGGIDWFINDLTEVLNFTQRKIHR
ncbi:MAG TPA: alpha/beta hydrolase-fold protein [Fulvivirga sp.]|nr:alpha/beta hydrolase-fold protein [Fulvivirga sp.]